MTSNTDLGLGAIYLGYNRCTFRVWAPRATRVDLHITAPTDRIIPMNAEKNGYFSILLEDVPADSRYLFRLDGEKERPDPASRAQPDGVHQPSAVVDFGFVWGDKEWRGIPIQQYIIYEMHVGTFTKEGTFAAAVDQLPRLLDLGITAIELMPVAHFPGNRNWGYDGVYLYAPHTAYGGVMGLKRFVEVCHQYGLAVIMDVVYNHLGPEGNYLWDYGYYFTDRYQTPWGAAVNFDGPHSDEVRRFFLENALMWVDTFHIDALRIDAVHAMRDFSAKTFMQELAEVVAQRAQRLGRQIFTIAESDQNDHRLVNPPALGGYGFDAQWSDDFHHIIHTLLTKEKDGYYQDFGTFNQLVQVYQAGWLYAGDYSPFRQRRHGNSPDPIPAYRLVVCNQNHDQIGNRMLGERLSKLVSSEQYNLAAALLLFSPFIPMLFMGEEYGEPAPFLYFVSHGDPDLIAAVREGRKAEFAAFAWKGEAPDPQDEATFTRSKIDHTLQKTILYEHIYMFYRECIQLRKQILALALLDKTNMAVQGFEQEQILLIHRWVDSHEVGLYQTYHTSKSIEGREVCLLFSLNSQKVVLQVPFPIGTWHRILNSNDKMWNPTKEYQLSEVPDTVTSTSDKSTITLTIDPFVCLVFVLREAL